MLKKNNNISRRGGKSASKVTRDGRVSRTSKKVSSSSVSQKSSRNDGQAFALPIKDDRPKDKKG